MSKTFRQTVRIGASPHEVYEALMDSQRHGAFTGSPAKITRRVGGTFSVFDGWATGKILELRKDARIIQTWRSDDFADGDPDSKVTFTLTKRGRGTALTLVHSHVPDDQYRDVKRGWVEFYWTPLKAYLEK